MTAITQVLLDDGTGSYPVDITAYVRWPEGIGLSGFGRADEFSQAAASSLSLVLDNADGLFAGGGSGFDTLPFGTGPFGGSIPVEPGTGIRYIETIGATVSTRFTGSVESLQLGWPGGGQEWAVVTLTAVDRLADLGGRPMRSMLEEEVLLDDPTAYYTLGEAEGSTSAGDTSGNAAPALTMTGTGTPVTFGQGTGPADGLTTATFAGGQYLSSIQLTAGRSYSILTAISRATAPATQECVFVNADSTAFLMLETTGKLSLYTGVGLLTLAGLVATSAATVCDGSVHLVGFSLASGSGYQMFTDAATLSAATTDTVTSTSLTVGGTVAFPVGFSLANLNGNLSHVAHFDGTVLTSGQVSAIWNVIGGSETTDARLSRLASYAGMTATTTTPSGQLMGTQATTGQSLFDALQAVAAAEGGVLYADGSGVLRMQGRYYRSLKTTADYTAPEQGVAPDTAVTWDRQQLINQITVTRTGGATQVISDGTPTRVFSASLDLAVATDADALYAAQWLLGKHKATSPRLASATFDLLTSSDAASLLALNIGARVSLPAMPSQMWAAGDYTIEGWSQAHTLTEHTLTVNLLPWDLAEVGIYDDAGSLYETAVYGY